MDESFERQRKQVVFRMLISGLIGALLTLTIGWIWISLKNNFNPPAGLGLLVISTIGFVIGALTGMMSKKWEQL
jgi:ABC-type antimicrobial peptide transport system permease subunit